jgi:hypothetical protein
MKYSDLYNKLITIKIPKKLPLGVIDEQDAFNTLQTELEGIDNLITDLHQCIKDGSNRLDNDYILRCNSLELIKHDKETWELHPLRDFAPLPSNYTKKRKARIIKLCSDIVSKGPMLLTNPYLIDYVGNDSQLDWRSIGNLLTAAINLVEHIGVYYDTNK